MFNRRHIMRMSAIACVTPLMGACASMSPENAAKADKAIKLAIRYTAIIANTLRNVAAQLSDLKLPGMTPAVWAVVNTSIDGAIKIANDLQSVTNVTTAQPMVQKFVSYVMTVMNTLTTLPLPDNVITGLRAATILLPFIETAVDLAVTNVQIADADEAERTLIALAN